MCSDVLRCSQMHSDDYRCFWIFSRYSIDVLSMSFRCSLDVLRMFAGFFQDVFRMLRWVLWAWWNLMIIWMKVCTLMIQRNPMIPNYLMIPAIWWSPAIRWSPAIPWSIGSMDFDNPKVFGDTSISDGLDVFREIMLCLQRQTVYSRRISFCPFLSPAKGLAGHNSPRALACWQFIS